MTRKNLAFIQWNSTARLSSYLLSHVAGKIKIIELQNENELIHLQKRTVVISTVYEHDKIQARIVDENNLFSVPTTIETLEDAYVYCMGGKNI